jgi:hypothetical protein
MWGAQFTLLRSDGNLISPKIATIRSAISCFSSCATSCGRSCWTVALSAIWVQLAAMMLMQLCGVPRPAFSYSSAIIARYCWSNVLNATGSIVSLIRPPWLMGYFSMGTDDSTRKPPVRAWQIARFSDSMSVGLITRTEDDVSRLAPENRPRDTSLGGLYSAGGTLAGAPTWPLWPGAVRHVQSESLKAHRTVSSAVYQLPAWRSVTASGLDKPKP